MQFGRFRIGMRTFKSALAVLICIIIFQIFGRGTPLIAALSAVFSLRQDLTSTFTFGKSRVIGNSIGGAAALLYAVMQNQFDHHFLVELLGLPILVALVISISDGFNNNSGIIAAIATLLMISLSIPNGESALYALERVLDTFIGTIVAIILNTMLRPPEPEESREIKHDLSHLQEQERELQQRLLEIQGKIKDDQQKK